MPGAPGPGGGGGGLGEPSAEPPPPRGEIRARATQRPGHKDMLPGRPPPTAVGQGQTEGGGKGAGGRHLAAGHVIEAPGLDVVAILKTTGAVQCPGGAGWTPTAPIPPTRLGPSVCRVTHDKKELDLTAPDMGMQLVPTELWSRRQLILPSGTGDSSDS